MLVLQQPTNQQSSGYASFLQRIWKLREGCLEFLYHEPNNWRTVICLNNSVLIDCINKKRERLSELASIHGSEAADHDSDDGESSRFNSNVNTFPRICDIVLNHPDAPTCSALLASQYSLQDKETNQNQPTLK
jgi:hypothetical protein